MNELRRKAEQYIARIHKDILKEIDRPGIEGQHAKIQYELLVLTFMEGYEARKLEELAASLCREG